MTCIPRQLSQSVAGLWYEETSGGLRPTSAWRTRQSYYAAMERVLKDLAPGETIDAQGVVAQHPRGATSTFYALASRNPLIPAYQKNVMSPMREIAEELVQDDKVSRMLAEAQVWSFWNRRRSWIRWVDDAYPGGDFAIVVRGLLEHLRHWRAQRPHLAAVGTGLPVCAVEDVVILSRGRVTPVAAADLIGRTLAGDLKALELPGTIDLRDPVRRRTSSGRCDLVSAVTFIRDAQAMLGVRPEQAAVRSKLAAALEIIDARPVSP